MSSNEDLVIRLRRLAEVRRDISNVVVCRLADIEDRLNSADILEAAADEIERLGDEKLKDELYL